MIRILSSRTGSGDRIRRTIFDGAPCTSDGDVASTGTRDVQQARGQARSRKAQVSEGSVSRSRAVPCTATCHGGGASRIRKRGVISKSFHAGACRRSAVSIYANHRCPCPRTPPTPSAEDRVTPMAPRCSYFVPGERHQRASVTGYHRQSDRRVVDYSPLPKHSKRCRAARSLR